MMPIQITHSMRNMSLSSEPHRSVSECEDWSGSPIPPQYVQMVDSILGTSPNSSIISSITTPRFDHPRFSFSEPSDNFFEPVPRSFERGSFPAITAPPSASPSQSSLITLKADEAARSDSHTPPPESPMSNAGPSTSAENFKPQIPSYAALFYTQPSSQSQQQHSPMSSSAYKSYDGSPNSMSPSPGPYGAHASKSTTFYGPSPCSPIPARGSMSAESAFHRNQFTSNHPQQNVFGRPPPMMPPQRTNYGTYRLPYDNVPRGSMPPPHPMMMCGPPMMHPMPPPPPPSFYEMNEDSEADGWMTAARRGRKKNIAQSQGPPPPHLPPPAYQFPVHYVRMPPPPPHLMQQGGMQQPPQSYLDELSYRSPLLLAFREDRLKNPLLTDLVGHIAEFAKDQHGSRYIQQKLEEGQVTDAERQILISEVLAAADSLIFDVFGNYVVQKCFEYGTKADREKLSRKLLGRVMRLSLHMYGCRVVQRALEHVDEATKLEILKELKPHVMRCVQDQNGNHVMQKAIEAGKNNPMQFQFIVDEFKKDHEGQNTIVQMSTHAYGCRVLQRLFEFGNEKQKEVLRVLKAHHQRLIRDQYGNYVVQHIIEYGHPEDHAKVLRILLDEVVALSQHKYASNVIEKVLVSEILPPSIRSELIESLIRKHEEQGNQSHVESPILAMAKNEYGNYVIQKMLDAADSNQSRKIMNAIRPYTNALRKQAFGKYIIAKLEKMYGRMGKEKDASPPPSMAGPSSATAKQQKKTSQ